MKHSFLALFTAAVSLSLSLCADTLVERKGAHNGIFTGFARTKISFQDWDMDYAETYDPYKIKEFKLDAPVQVTFYSYRNGSKGTAATMEGFSKDRFQFVIDGQKKEISPRELYRIDVDLDPKVVQKRLQEAIAAKEEANPDEPGSINRMAVKGKATILYFYENMDQAQADALKKLCDASQGKAVFRPVHFAKGLEDPTAKKSHFTRLPQTWIYSAYGALYKMAEDATQEQLSETFANALKGAK